MIEVAFLIIALASLVALFFASNKHVGVALLYTSSALVIGTLSYQGFFKDTTSLPPRFLLIILPALLISLIAYRWLDSSKVSMKWLIGIQLIRIPVEILLHQLYLNGQIPQLMTYEGQNFDIVSGLLALALLLFYRNKPINSQVLRAFNWIALLLLLNIVVSAILSAPSPLQQLAFDQPNVAILTFPFTLLPAVVVPVVLLAQLMIFKKLKKGRS